MASSRVAGSVLILHSTASEWMSQVYYCLKKESRRSIRKSGWMNTARFPKVTTSTTAIMTRSTTIRAILSVCQPMTITPTMLNCSLMSRENGSVGTLSESVLSRLNGTDQRLDVRGTVSMVSGLGQSVSQYGDLAISAETSLTASPDMMATDSVQATASLLGDEPAEWITRNGDASNAESLSPSIATPSSGSVTVRVVGSRAEREPHPVYNLTVEGQPEYFANSILVHNCRYMVMALDDPRAVIGQSIGSGARYSGARTESRRVSRGSARGRR